MNADGDCELVWLMTSFHHHSEAGTSELYWPHIWRSSST